PMGMAEFRAPTRGAPTSHQSRPTAANLQNRSALRLLVLLRFLGDRRAPRIEIILQEMLPAHSIFLADQQVYFGHWKWICRPLTGKCARYFLHLKDVSRHISIKLRRSP